MWYACAIAIGNFSYLQDLKKKIELSHGITIEPVPNWIRGAYDATGLSTNDKYLIKCSLFSLSAEYEAEALGSPDPHWNGKSTRSIQAGIEEKFSLANVAFWLVKSSPFTFGPVLHYRRIGDPTSFARGGLLKHILIGNEEHGNIFSQGEFLETGRFLAKILDLERNTTLWSSIRTLISALTEKNWEIRYLLQWIVLETIFGPDNGDLSYRISQRVSFFLGRDSTERKKIFQDMKKGYKWRSKIAHGASLDSLSPEDSLELTQKTESLIRNAVRKILEEPTLQQSINGTQRNEFLDDLVFQ